jgi:hypothetical protein
MEKTHQPMNVEDADNSLKAPPHDLSRQIRQLIAAAGGPIAAREGGVSQ